MRTNILAITTACLALLLSLTAGLCAAAPRPPLSVPVLVYHRFGPTVADDMTVTTADFESHLKYLKNNGFTVIPLKRLVDHLRGEAPAPHERSVVITIDDGHRTVYSDIYPLIKQYGVPVTLFIYPSAISNASYGMTWEQLKELRGTPLFDIQSHTYWHPNFKTEKKRLAPKEYEKFVEMQLTKPRQKLKEMLDVETNILAWPFGIHDDELIAQASKAGYIATLTLIRRPVRDSDNSMTLPRYLMAGRISEKAFGKLMAESLVPPHKE